MATKEQMRLEILDLEPSNAIAAQKSASHAELKAELTAVKRRLTLNQTMEAVEVDVVYRLEDDESMSWRVTNRADGADLAGLVFGPELPRIGQLIEFDPEIPVQGLVKTVESGLQITAGDLPEREVFDPRRIYATPSGTMVTYMREERERIVLWSYKVQSEIMINQSVALTRTDRRAQPTAKKKRKKSQKLVAAYLIAQDPEITPRQLTALLKEAFPSANIDLDGRHGPHYLSLSRTGKLPIAPEDDPRDW